MALKSVKIMGQAKIWNYLKEQQRSSIIIISATVKEYQRKFNQLFLSKLRFSFFNILRLSAAGKA
jgi:hypothetical protein